jgi:hypothetical protein
MTLRLAHQYEQYSDYEAFHGNTLIRVTLVEGSEPYLTIWDASSEHGNMRLLLDVALTSEAAQNCVAKNS